MTRYIYTVSDGHTILSRHPSIKDARETARALYMSGAATDYLAIYRHTEDSIGITTGHLVLTYSPHSQPRQKRGQSKLDTAHSIGTRLRDHAAAHGTSADAIIHELAEKTGLSVNTIANWHYGITNPTPDNARAVNAALDTMGAAPCAVSDPGTAAAHVDAALQAADQCRAALTKAAGITGTCTAHLFPILDKLREEIQRERKRINKAPTP